MNKARFHNVTLIAIGLLTLLAGPVLAQTGSMRAEIPFQFVVENQVLPAGLYQVDVAPAVNRLTIRAVNGSTGVYLLLPMGHHTAIADQGTLVFHKYGATSFLRMVSMAGHATAYEMRKSTTEKEMAKTGAGVEVAMVFAQPR